MAVRCGIISLLIKDREKAAAAVNQVLYRYSHLLLGRMGLPNRRRGIYMIAVMVEGEEEELEKLFRCLQDINSVEVRRLFVS